MRIRIAPAREEFEDLLAVDEECDGVDGFDADLGE
jgi:hypothetical protein